MTARPSKERPKALSRPNDTAAGFCTGRPRVRSTACSGSWMARCDGFQGKSLSRCILPIADSRRRIVLGAWLLARAGEVGAHGRWIGRKRGDPGLRAPSGVVRPFGFIDVRRRRRRGLAVQRLRVRRPGLAHRDRRLGGATACQPRDHLAVQRRPRADRRRGRQRLSRQQRGVHATIPWIMRSLALSGRQPAFRDRGLAFSGVRGGSPRIAVPESHDPADKRTSYPRRLVSWTNAEH